MRVPNQSFIVEELCATGKYKLYPHEELASFHDDAVVALHEHDPNWVHIKKNPGQTQVHGHGEDSALYLLPDGKAQGCDFIQDAGVAHAKLRWGPDPEPYYKHSDGWDAHGDWSEEPAPPSTTPKYPTYEEL